MRKNNGIDVSHHQGAISPKDWQAVRASGIEFVFLKATEGTRFKDSQFATNRHNALFAGLKVGAYHFFRPSKDAREQAEFFLRTIGTLNTDELAPVVDIESADGQTPAQIVKGLKTFLSIVEARTHRKPFVYTYVPFWKTQVGNSKEFGEYPLWIARYSTTQKPQMPLGAWEDFTIWQWTQNGKIAGIKTDCDVNEYGNGKSLISLFSPADDETEAELFNEDSPAVQPNVDENKNGSNEVQIESPTALPNTATGEHSSVFDSIKDTVGKVESGAVELKKESPSLYTKILTGILTALGAVLSFARDHYVLIIVGLLIVGALLL